MGRFGNYIKSFLHSHIDKKLDEQDRKEFHKKQMAVNINYGLTQYKLIQQKKSTLSRAKREEVVKYIDKLVELKYLNESDLK